MLEVQKYLLNHSLNDLEKGFDVESSNPTYKFSLNYSQLSNKINNLTNQCRGLILGRVSGNSLTSKDEIVGETIVLCYPFNRFFNLGDKNAAEINFDNARFENKLDGTLINLYFDLLSNEWCVATRGVPEANLPIHRNEEYTFRSLFEEALLETIKKSNPLWFRCSSGRTPWMALHSLSNLLNKNETYIFELTSPINRVVVEYENSSVTLIGARNNKTYQEFNQIIEGIPSASSYSFKSLQDILNYISKQDPKQHEGIIAVDNNFNRIKIKNPNYVLFHKLKDKLKIDSPRNLLEVVLLNKQDDVKTILHPKIQQELILIQEKLYHFVEKHHRELKEIKDLPTRKEFAIEVQKRKLFMGYAIEYYLNSRLNNFDTWAESKKDKQTNTFSEAFLDIILKQIGYT